tara:strand:+ start:82 stop:1278 length:1197 start_codon:yes stop_codon:yes gene_type:complete
MITYKAIIQYFDSIAEQHQQINSFTYGEVNFFDKDKFTDYPALHLTPTGVSIDDQVVVYGFDVIVFDRYNVESNKMRNEATCLSDSLLIFQDLCKEITDGKYFINVDTLISMEMPVAAQPFIDTEPDNCSGWVTSFNVITPNESTACNIPYYLTEIWNNKNVTLPTGVPNTDYAWFSMMDLSRNLVQSGTEMTSLNAFVDEIGGTDILSRVGDDVKYDFSKHALHIQTKTSATDCYLTQLTKSLDGSRWTFFLKIKDFNGYTTHSNKNKIFKVTNGSGTDIEMRFEGSSGNIAFQSPVAIEYSDFPVVPIGSELKRKEPLVLAFTFDSSATYMKCFYGAGNPIQLARSGININGFDLQIGTEGQVGTSSDFYLQEFIMAENVYTDDEIEATREWLKYR